MVTSRSLTKFERSVLRLVASRAYLKGPEVAAARRLEARGFVELEDNGEKPSDWNPRRSDGERWSATLTEDGERRIAQEDGRIMKQDIDKTNFRQAATDAIAKYADRLMLVDALLWGRIVGLYEERIAELEAAISGGEHQETKLSPRGGK